MQIRPCRVGVDINYMSTVSQYTPLNRDAQVWCSRDGTTWSKMVWKKDSDPNLQGGAICIPEVIPSPVQFFQENFYQHIKDSRNFVPLQYIKGAYLKNKSKVWVEDASPLVESIDPIVSVSGYAGHQPYFGDVTKNHAVSKKHSIQVFNPVAGQVLIFRTTDGKNWTQVDDITGTNFNPRYIGFIAPDTYFITMESPVGVNVNSLISFDGGITWRNTTGFRTPQGPLYFDINQDKGYIVMTRVTTNASIIVSIDGGKSFYTSTTLSGGGNQFQNTNCQDEQLWVVIRSGASLSYSTDFGITWTIDFSYPPIGGGDSQILRTDSNKFLVAGEDKTFIYKGSPGSWAKVLETDDNFGLKLTEPPDQKGKIFIAHAAGYKKAYITKDEGDTWKTITLPAAFNEIVPVYPAL